MRTEIEKSLFSDLLIESSIDAMIAIGTDEVIFVWNHAASVLFDRSQKEMIGKVLFAALPSLKDDAGFKTAIKWAMEGKKSFLGPAANFRHRTHAETHLIPLMQGETVVGVMLLIHDVAHRIAKEKELQQLNDELKTRLRQLNLINNELSQLTHIASHNVREPIREIYTAVEWLVGSEAAVMSASGKATFRRIQSSLNRMNLLLDDIITLTQINILDRPGKVIDMTEVVQELKTQFTRKLENSKTEFTVGDLCDIRAHRNHVILLLQQVFSNLIKFAGPVSSKINVFCEKKEHAIKTPDGLHAAEYFIITVQHNSLAFDNVAPCTSPQIQAGSDPHTYTGQTLAVVLICKIMELHSGFFVNEKAADGTSHMKFYFPVSQRDH